MNGINYLIAQGVTPREPAFNFLDAEKKALEIKRMRQEVEAYPQDAAWREEQRGMARQKEPGAAHRGQVRRTGGRSTESQGQGRVMVNAVPRPSWLSTEMEPPCRSTSSRAMASPRP